MPDQWVFFASFDLEAKKWSATMDGTELSGTLAHVVTEIGRSGWRIVSVVAQSILVTKSGKSDNGRNDVVTYAIFVVKDD